ncbi:MAG: hypothetical protein GX432_08295 [Candidatus Atribacteria bacterium]|nr:hypothetical protein [Candidatus Atribacteria bacterium]
MAISFHQKIFEERKSNDEILMLKGTSQGDSIEGLMLNCILGIDMNSNLWDST